MPAPARTAIRDAFRRWRRGPRTLIDCASRVELDARELRDATPISPARLIVTLADTAQACGHLADASDGWARWLGRHATSTQPDAPGELSSAVSSARSALGALAEQLRHAQTEAGEAGNALDTVARHNPQPPQQP